MSIYAFLEHIGTGMPVAIPRGVHPARWRGMVRWYHARVGEGTLELFYGFGLRVGRVF